MIQHSNGDIECCRAAYCECVAHLADDDALDPFNTQVLEQPPRCDL
jgi:hypothetical protein